ncbi:MAG TPA: hypothetical protein VK607_21720, partial [Kofleriaceae bacterium]|nr:hypothetical protein [Kofleriaceae bacterium]
MIGMASRSLPDQAMIEHPACQASGRDNLAPGRYLTRRDNPMQSRSAISTVLAFALAAACGRSASAPPPAAARPAAAAATARPDQEARLIAVDVFDTDPSSVEHVQARHGDALRALLRDPADANVRAVTEAIRADGGYAYVEPSTVTYYEPQGRISYLTIDIVDQRDVAQRMAFSPRPTGTHADPGGLIAAWQAYEAAAFSLLARGELSAPPADCPSFHCFGDPRQPALRSLAAEMAARVPAHVDELATILRDDSRHDHRG